MNEQEYGSNLVSLPAVILFFVLFVTAEYYGQTGAGIFLAGGFLFSLTALLWSRGALKRLSAEVEGRSCRVFPGQEISFILKVKNDKWLPLFWLTVKLPKPDRGILPAMEKRLNWLLPWQEIRWEQRWAAEKRGTYFLDRVHLYSGDGLGLAVRHTEEKTGRPLLFVIYPRIVPVRLSALPRFSSEMTAGKQGYLEDVTLLRSSRGYQPGDGSRRINWRILARQGQLDVNLYETVHPGQVTFLLDLEAFSDYEIMTENGVRKTKVNRFYEEELEDMISLAASVIAALAEKKDRTALILPRTRTDREQTIREEDPERNVTAMLTALSGIRYRGGAAVWPGWERESPALLGECLVFSRNLETAARLRILEKLPEQRIHRILWERGGGSTAVPATERKELLG